jgi:Ca-activated chloride channel family protein
MVTSARIRGTTFVLAAALAAGACAGSSATTAPFGGLSGNGNGNAPRPAATAAASMGGPAQAPQAAASAAPSVAGANTGNQPGPTSIPGANGGNLPGATPGDVTFSETGLNPYVSTSRDHLSTFGLDVDTASYTLARSYVNNGNLPDPAGVRVEEWVNSFDQGYAAPETGTFAIHSDGVPAPFLTGSTSESEVLLRVGVKARTVTRAQRQDASLTFVIDTSGSMQEDGKLEMVKSALRLLVDQLRPSDRVAIVAFSTEARVVLPSTNGDNRDRIMGAIDELQPEQTTNVEAGLSLGYSLARESMLEGGINRVILASDGVANVGATSASAILADVSRDAAAGIQEVSIGVGFGNYNDALLEQLADKGDGFYAYINNVDEAHRVFVEKLVSTIDTVALDAKAQVDFNPDVVAEYRLIGYENRAIADQDFRNNNVAAGAIGAGHAVTALYGLKLRERVGAGNRVATVSVRWTDPSTKGATEIAQDVTGADITGSWGDADPHLRLDTLVAAAAETFRGSPWISDFSLAQLADAARNVRNDLPRTSQVDDFLTMLDQSSRLAR